MRKSGGHRCVCHFSNLVPDSTPSSPPFPKYTWQMRLKHCPEASCLVSQKAFRIYTTTADQSPGIMREIGRLRERSFRDVGEGTGQSQDTDEFDAYYQQLFLWNCDKEEIVGAYRLGETRSILEERGPRGLYTTSLFDYQPSFLGHLGCALELGSFVHSQRVSAQVRLPLPPVARHRRVRGPQPSISLSLRSSQYQPRLPHHFEKT